MFINIGFPPQIPLSIITLFLETVNELGLRSYAFQVILNPIVPSLKVISEGMSIEGKVASIFKILGFEYGP